MHHTENVIGRDFMKDHIEKVEEKENRKMGA